MKKIIMAIVTFILINSSSIAQSSFPSYYEQNKFNLASPSVLKFGLYGYDNPALLSLQPSADLLFTWSDRTGEWNDLNHWGFFFAAPSVGFSVVNNPPSEPSLVDQGNTDASSVSLSWVSGVDPDVDGTYDQFEFDGDDYGNVTSPQVINLNGTSSHVHR